MSSENRLFDDGELTRLPNPVKNWLIKSGALGKPLIKSAIVTQKADLQMRRGLNKWLPASALQYTCISEPSFLWTVDVKMNRFIKFKGRDKFEDGKGEMLIKLNSLITVVNEKGPKMDEGTIQRYLGEMVWYPSLAVSPFITWEEIDESSAGAMMDYKGTIGSGKFFFSPEGDVVKYSALRYNGNRANSKRYEWIMDIYDYSTFDGIKVPSKMEATWRFDDGDWTWLKLYISDIKYAF